jgi:uncharacterized protein (TIRG00374 family)
LLAQQASKKKEEVVLTALLDRFLGLFGLFLVAACAVFLSLPFLIHLGQEHRLIQFAAYLIGLGSAVGFFTIGLIVFRDKLLALPVICRIVNHGKLKLPVKIMKSLTRLVNALELYRRNRLSIILAIVLSVLIHICLALNLYLIGAGVNEHLLGLRHYFLAVPVANAVAAIPLTPGGIGTRDATIALLFNAMQASPEKAGVVPVVLSLIILFWGLVGGMMFVFSKRPHATIQEAIDLQYSGPGLPDRDITQGQV